MKEPSSPQKRTDPGRPDLGNHSDLGLRETSFGPCNQEPSNRIFSPRTRILRRGKESLPGVKAKLFIPDSAQESERQVEKLACLIYIKLYLVHLFRSPELKYLLFTGMHNF